MTQQPASAQEIDLFVKAATAKLVESGMTEETATEQVITVLSKRASDLGILEPAQALTAQEITIGTAHQKLVDSGMTSKEAAAAIETHLIKIQQEQQG